MPRDPLIHRTLHLLDPRPPQDVQADLERATGAVFARPDPGAPATREARFTQAGLHFRCRLAFQSAGPALNHYALGIAAHADAGLTDEAALRRSAEAWIALWTASLPAPSAPPDDAGSAPRHRALVDAWQAAEAAFDDVATTQQAILRALRDGAQFRSAHKEGGTTIAQAGTGYVRVDYGEHEQTWRYATPEAFLAFLRQYYDYETSRHVWPAKVPDTDAWRLIYRKLAPADPDLRGGGAGQQRRCATRLLTLVAGCALAAGMAHLKWHPKAEALRAEDAQPVVLDRLPAPPRASAAAERATADFRQAVETAKALR